MALDTVNINVSLVNNTLNAGVTDVYGLCTSDKINKWSKYKPVRLSAANSVNNTDWFRATDGNCGYEIPYIVYADTWALSPLSATTAVTDLDWNYLKPTGGTNSPYRLGDFRGYEHEANESMIIDTTYNLDLFNSTGENFVFGYWLDGGIGNNSVNTLDLTGLTWSNMRMIAVVFDRNTTPVHKFTFVANSHIADENAQIVGDVRTLANGYYDVYFMFYDTINYKFYPIMSSPTVNPATFHKYYTNHLIFENLQFSYAYNGTYYDWYDVDYTTNRMYRIKSSNGKVSTKVTFTNDAVSGDYTIASSYFKYDGMSVWDDGYINEAVVMRSGSTTITSFVCHAGESHTVTIESQNGILFWNGTIYTSPSNGTWTDYTLNLNFDNGTNLDTNILSGSLEIEYDGTSGFETI